MDRTVLCQAGPANVAFALMGEPQRRPALSRSSNGQPSPQKPFDTARVLASTLREGKYVPFGPFLVGGGVAAMLWGPGRIMQAVFSVLGL